MDRSHTVSWLLDVIIDALAFANNFTVFTLYFDDGGKLNTDGFLILDDQQNMVLRTLFSSISAGLESQYCCVDAVADHPSAFHIASNLEA